MKKVATIRLDTQEDISLAHAIFTTYIWDIDAVVGRYCVDAKNLLGLLMFQSKEMDIYLHTDYADMKKEFREELEDWIIKN